MEELIEILKEFDSRRDEMKKNVLWNDNAVAECFFPCAEKILLGGYFLINGKYIIDLGCIELYYHEELGFIKDPIMYHTNNHGPYSIHYKSIGKYPYFKMGSFNLHQSGVDITFENPDKEYRASFLIRSYRVFETNDNERKEDIEYTLKDVSNPKYNPHSTHIFDDMFPNGIVFGDNPDVKIEWVRCHKGGEIERCNRMNVYEYEKDNNGEFKKEKDKFVKSYVKELKEWGFKRIGMNEYK